MRNKDFKCPKISNSTHNYLLINFQSQLHMSDVSDATPNTHTFFVDEGEEKDFDLAKRLDTHPDLIGRKSNRPRLSTLKKMNMPDTRFKKYTQ